MSGFSKIKYLRISSTKLKKYIQKIRNKTYKEALKIINIFPYRIKRILWKLLNSAAYNALNNFNKDKDSLKIEFIFVTHAGILKRFRARARGKSFKIQKKLSHLQILLN